MILVNWPISSVKAKDFSTVKILTVIKHPQTTDDRTREHLSTQEVNERYLVDTRPLYVQSHCPKSHTHPVPFLSLPKLQSHRQSRFGLIIYDDISVNSESKLLPWGLLHPPLKNTSMWDTDDLVTHLCVYITHCACCTGGVVSCQCDLGLFSIKMSKEWICFSYIIHWRGF